MFLARLADGSVSSEGRVELFLNGAWGTVCDNWWDIREARVVCRQLGFPDAREAVVGAAFGPGSGPILLVAVNCQGDENDLMECPHEGVGVHYCRHSWDVGVICGGFLDWSSRP